MRLLITNDDGILALGIECLCAAAEPLGEVTVVAPDREQSATSHSLTLHHPLRPIRRRVPRMEALMPDKPDFVLSGINHGQNMGEDVLYSGTVAAAMEGLALGIPSIALSLAGGDHGSTDVSKLPDQIPTVSRLLAHLVSLSLPKDTLLNINLPPREARGIRLTRLGRRVFSDPLRRMQDPWGKEVYWIGGGTMAWTGGP